MNILCIFMVLSVVHFCQSRFPVNKLNGMPLNKSQEVETFTTILLDGEAFSLESTAKKLHKQTGGVPLKEKENISLGKLSKSGSHHLKGSERMHGVKGKPNLSISLEDKAPLNNKKGSHSTKRFVKQPSKIIHHEKRSNILKKKLQKRNFDTQQENVWNLGENEQRNEAGKEHIKTYRFALNHADSTTTNWRSDEKVTKNSQGNPAGSNVQTTSEKTHKDFSQIAEDSLWEGDKNYRIYRPDRQPKTNTIPNFEARNESVLNSDGSPWQNNNAFIVFQQPVHTTTKWSIAPYPNFHASSFTTANIVLRNIPSSSQKPKSEREKLEDQLRTDEAEADDANIVFEGNCDQIVNETCWMTREIGDVLTLSLKIESSKSPDSFQIRWLRVYHVYNSKKGKPLEIEPGKLPWNMVSGSEGRELRLNPVTNTDIDPNCIVAKVFLLSKQRGKVLFTHLKKLIFRIDIPIIDMGKIYAGEELSINLENFISLPERGNLIFDWTLETKPHEPMSLPSNVKVSNSGRSVVLKELKKGRLGVLNCVVYSSNRYAVAKRRFNILKIAENVKRRSTLKYPGSGRLALTLKRSLRCRRIIRRSQEKAMQRLEEGTKPKSRKKRFKRMGPHYEDIDCEPLRKKIYSRWIRSLFGEYTTTDPRLMPLDKLFELSEEGDGTLDDIIPHEVHYVESKVRLLNGTSRERTVSQSHASHNCTSDADCGNNAICTVPLGLKDVLDHSGHCFCRPEFFGDGFTCQKIPMSNHREKRLRRDARKDFVVPEHLFYEQVRRAPSTTGAGTEDRQDDEDIETPPKVLAFEEEESFLLSDCIDDKDCSSHANCIQPSNGHPYCKCQPGFRGNGVFCWEIIDYVPPEENFVMDEEISPKGANNLGEASMIRLASRAPVPNELDDV